MSAEQDFSPQAERRKLREMKRRMSEAKRALSDQDLETAIENLSGMTDGTDCSICIGIETYLLSGLNAVKYAPGGRTGVAASFVIDELDHFVERLEEVI